MFGEVSEVKEGIRSGSFKYEMGNSYQRRGGDSHTSIYLSWPHGFLIPVCLLENARVCVSVESRA